jgi:hypothetical protein
VENLTPGAGAFPVRFAPVPRAGQVIRVFAITRMRERLDLLEEPREMTTGT